MTKRSKQFISSHSLFYSSNLSLKALMIRKWFNALTGFDTLCYGLRAAARRIARSGQRQAADYL